MIESPQILYDMPAAEYHALDRVSSTLLRNTLKKSPHAAKHDREHPDDGNDGDRPVFSAVHASLFEGHDVMLRRYALYSGKRDARTDAYQAWVKANPGIEAMTSRQWDLLNAMLEAATAQGIREQLGKGVGEVTLLWTDTETGLLCKARLDWWRHAIAAFCVVDGKCIGEQMNNIELLAKYVIASGYDIQAALYLFGLAANGYTETGWAHLWMNVSAPHDMRILPVSQAVLAYGAKRMREAMGKWASARASGVYPRALADVAELDLPDWLARREAFEAAPATDAATVADIDEVFNGQ